jgi:hypothetical protein
MLCKDYRTYAKFVMRMQVTCNKNPMILHLFSHKVFWNYLGTWSGLPEEFWEKNCPFFCTEKNMIKFARLLKKKFDHKKL